MNAIQVSDIIVFLVQSGRDRFQQFRNGWNFIISGFGLLLFGSILDISDNFESLNRFVIVGDNEFEAFLEKFVGFLGGFVLLAVGLFKWVPGVQGLSDLVDTRTRYLQESNKLLISENAKRTEATRALGESEERYHALFEQAGDAIFLINPETAGILEANTRACETLGYRRDELVGLTVPDISPHFPKGAFADLAERIGSEEVMVVKTEHQRKDGFRFPVEIRTRRSVIGGEEILLALARDMTDREGTEQALRESEERFSKAFHANPAAMVISIIENGKILDVNESWLSFMGVAREEVLGKTATEVGGWVDIEQRAIFIERLKREGRVLGFEADLRPKNGEVKTAVLSAETIEIGGEQGLLMVFSDVTERKEMERALRESESRLRAVFDNTPICLNLKDTEGRYLLVNKPYEEWFGRSAEEIVGKKASEFLPEVMEVSNFTDAERSVLDSGEVMELDLTIPRLEHAVLEEGEAYKKEGKALRYDGTLHDRYLIKFPVKSEDGSINAIGTVAIDVTERKFMERQLQHAQKMEAVGQLTGGIAHDFNNLLQVIQSNLELAIQGTDGGADQIRGLINHALSASQRGGKLTQQLLAFSRTQTLYPEITDPKELIQGMLEILVRTLGEDIEVETTIEDEIEPITIDKNGLENAILNIAVNAKKAMPKGGRLIIGCTRRHLAEGLVTEDGDLPGGWYVEISFTDTGYGMSPEVLAHALEPFYTTREVGEGSGLGLSMVYGFAKQSDGHMTIESEIDKGTTVRILIPSVQKSEVRAPAEPPN